MLNSSDYAKNYASTIGKSLSASQLREKNRHYEQFCGVFIWEISVRSTGMNSRNATKMLEHKLVLFATAIALWTLVALLIKLIRILLKLKYKQDQNYAIFAAML